MTGLTLANVVSEGVIHVLPASRCFLMCRDTSQCKLVEGTNLPILRLILNAILSNAFQRIIEANIRALPYHGRWSGTEVHLDDKVIGWSESDMTAAFHYILLEPMVLLEHWLRNLIPHWQRSQECIQVCWSYIFINGVRARCSVG